MESSFAQTSLTYLRAQQINIKKKSYYCREKDLRPFSIGRTTAQYQAEIICFTKTQNMT